MSRFLPRIVIPDDVRAYRLRLDAYARSLDKSLAFCTNLDPVARIGWSEFYRSWRSFCAEDASWLHAAAQYDETERYEANLVRWQTWLEGHCRLSGPSLSPPSEEPSPIPSTLKTVAIAGAIVAVALAVRSVSR